MAKNVVNSLSSPLQVILREFHDESLDDSNSSAKTQLSSQTQSLARADVKVQDVRNWSNASNLIAVQAFNTTPFFAHQGTWQYFTLGLYDGLFFLMKGQAWFVKVPLFALWIACRP